MIPKSPITLPTFSAFRIHPESFKNVLGQHSATYRWAMPQLQTFQQMIRNNYAIAALDKRNIDVELMALPAHATIKTIDGFLGLPIQYQPNKQHYIPAELTNADSWVALGNMTYNPAQPSIVAALTIKNNDRLWKQGFNIDDSIRSVMGSRFWLVEQLPFVGIHARSLKPLNLLPVIDKLVEDYGKPLWEFLINVVETHLRRAGQA